jgi:hypothetical protein
MLEADLDSFAKELEELRKRPDGYLDDYEDDRDIIVAKIEADINDTNKMLDELDWEEDEEAQDRAYKEDAEEKRALTVGLGISRFC